MSNYSAKYEKQFTQNLCRYASLRQRIKRSVERVLSAPYNSEFLGDISGKLKMNMGVFDDHYRKKQDRKGIYSTS